MVLENVREMWTEVPHGGKKKAKPVNKARSICLRHNSLSLMKIIEVIRHVYNYIYMN